MCLTWFWKQTGTVRRYDVDDYIQYDRKENSLLAHFDGILNAGVNAAHETSPDKWVNLVDGGVNLVKHGDAAFKGDAWVSDGSSCFTNSFENVLKALKDKKFTLEMMISHPNKQNEYEYWAFFGDGTHRNLSVDFRSNNSKNPLVQGLQYRAAEWNKKATIANSNGNTTKWNTRQYIAVVCDGNTATAYYDGTNKLHSTTGVSDFTPAPSLIGIGGFPSVIPANCLYSGSEICAVRMTAQAMPLWQIEYNNSVDQVRFYGNVTVKNGLIGDTENVGSSSASDGVYDIASGTWTITAPFYDADGSRFQPILTVETLINGEWANKRRLWTNSYTVDKSAIGDSRIRLTWTWDVPKGLRVIIR
jgi:hypothetical protein